MKRIIALALALLVLFSVAAYAETQATRVVLGELSLSYIDNGRARTVRFKNITLNMIMGASGDIPTVQATFDNGSDQQVDGVVQIVGNEVLLSVGGITGVYALDLTRHASKLGNLSGDATVASVLSKMLSMAGTHMDMMLYAMTSEGKNGMRSLTLNVPTGGYVAAMEGVIALIDGLEAVEDDDVDDLRERVESVNDSAQLAFTYSPSSGKFAVSVSQEGKTIQLAGVMTLSVENVTFIDIGEDEERYDLLNLDPEVLNQLRGEIGLISLKFIHFADGSGLAKLLGQ